MPVYFQWQILDWNIPAASIHEMGLTLEVYAMTQIVGPVDGRRLFETDPPDKTTGDQGKLLETKTFRTRKAADYGWTAARDTRIDRAVQLLVLACEKHEATTTGLTDLAETV